MKYFEVLALVVFFAGSVGWFWRFNRRLRRDYYGKIITRALLGKAAAGNGIFISGPLKRLTGQLLNSSSAKAKQQLTDLCEGKIDNLSGSLLKSAEISAALAALSSSGKALERLEQPAAGGDICMIRAWILFHCGRTEEAETCREKETSKKLSRFGKGLNAYLEAAAALRDGDLLTASEKASESLKLLRSDGAPYEAAKAYFLLGTIYRISAVSDVAQLMFTEAADIFQNLGADKDAAETIGSRGMLMAAENRREEAAADFAKALDLYRSCGCQWGEADILNQQALTALMYGESAEAGKLAEAAAAMQKAAGQADGSGLSAEILSRAAAEKKDWASSLKYAAEAKQAYQAAGNQPGLFEALLLLARARLETGNFETAERLLRHLIEQAKKCPSCFHVANAYNLLGIIYLKQGDLQRAKGLFQQSLGCESSNNRTDGMAIDYANLALIEYRLGQQEQGDKTVQTALEYARAFGETELSQLLEKQLNKNRVRP